MFGLEFLIRGANDFNEPGVCLSFQETEDELASNVASLGFNLRSQLARKKLAVDHVLFNRSLIHETGEYDLEALFIRLAQAIDSVKAKRILLDSVEALFDGVESHLILRAELQRLFDWLKRRGLTAVVTGERGQGALTRYGLEEYISDCVILLDQRISDTILTRRLRVVKYRGSCHGTNEYPFLIDDQGISVLPVTSICLQHSASQDRVSSGVPALDSMLGGKGYFRGSSILISGTAGTGKTSLSAHFIDAACARGERCVFFSFEESPEQIIRNMRSLGLNLSRWVSKNLLRFSAARPTTYGLENHLSNIHKILNDFRPSIVVADPVTGLLYSGDSHDTRSMLLRLIDFLKEKQITALLTSLTSSAGALEETSVDVSSLVDTWLLLRDLESNGERNRGLYILKARGIAHSNQIREFLMTNRGVDLRPVYLGEEGMLTGTARRARELKDSTKALIARQSMQRKQLSRERRRRTLLAQIKALQAELQSEDQESRQLMAQEQLKIKKAEIDRGQMAHARSINVLDSPGGSARIVTNRRRKP